MEASTRGLGKGGVSSVIVVVQVHVLLTLTKTGNEEERLLRLCSILDLRRSDVRLHIWVY